MIKTLPELKNTRSGSGHIAGPFGIAVTNSFRRELM
jgi:hypothetical protein